MRQVKGKVAPSCRRKDKNALGAKFKTEKKMKITREHRLAMSLREWRNKKLREGFTLDEVDQAYADHINEERKRG